MTRILRIRFRRLVVAVVSAGALGLVLGTAAASSAATTGQPYPTPTPTVHQVYPPKHHKPREVCFYSLETEHDTLAGQSLDPGSYTSPATDAYGQPQGKQQPAEEIEVVQLVKVCVTGDKVQVWDESGPYGWEQQQGAYPTPSGLPDNIGGMLTQ